MAGKGLSELELKDEVLPAQSFDDLPETGRFGPPPQPGTYRWRLPSNLETVWDTTETAKGQRIQAIFDRDAPLTIVQSPGNKTNGETFTTRLSNFERARMGGTVEASDLDYLLRAMGDKVRPSGNKAYIQAVKQHAGKEFTADITFNWTCDPKRPIYVQLENGETEKVESQMGCGQRYYSGTGKANAEKKIAYIGRGEDGTYPVSVICGGCGSVLRAFANLDNIRA